MSFFSSLFKSKSSENINILNAEEFQNEIKNKKVRLVDVRTSGEYNSGHIKNAVNVDFFNRTAFQKFFSKLNKEEPIYLYCRSGNRSRKAAYMLEKMGFTSLTDLKGGYMAWQRNQ
ncbi:rhodanese-like domain-containing protein [Maribacter thermophilus]|uniref:rhodanese-like domain-containing protein n=1 Tax=Maribacter thermophilus TaxID=1197874 RepID=UPI00064159B3|nr:rhodanese-like domain-containing protein [Maribacter thermophilus]